ncbi:IS3 family transposase [Spirillospora sp. NPDC050679]
MYRQLGVSKSGYYLWRNRPDSTTARRREELRLLVKKAFEMSDGTYGHRRVRVQLLRWGVAVGLELVRELMRGLGPGVLPAPRQALVAHPGGRRPGARFGRARLQRRCPQTKTCRRHHLCSHR